MDECKHWSLDPFKASRSHENGISAILEADMFNSCLADSFIIKLVEL
jgi:hypothetical protein